MFGEALEEEYQRRTPTSASLRRRAAKSLPGGDTRSVTHHLPYSLVMERGEGAFLWDVDGNRYIDALCNYTSLVHGHAYPPVVEAVRSRLDRGFVWPAGSLDQFELAESLVARVGSVERVRFCNSGTEAGMLAARVARAATGRPLLLKAATGYHGSYDDLLTPEGGQNLGDRTLLAPYGDAAAFEQQLAASGDRIAAVFLEPVLGAGGIVEGDEEFLRRVERAARRAGSVFVLDEVITLRLAVGGLQAECGLAPDLTMLGKLIGGGLPVGALGGSAELMRLFDPYEGPVVSHSGTFNGNPLTCAAGRIALDELTEARIAVMKTQAASLAATIRQAAAASSLNVEVRCVGSLLNVTIQPDAVSHEADGVDLTRMFYLASLNQGAMIAPRGMLALSTVFTDELVKELGARLGAAFVTVAKAMHGRE